jgi:Holliday junction resolvase RusA-like endonuclease
MKTIVVTGGAGFIGANLCIYLHETSNQNHIICKCISNSNEENTHFKYHLVDDNIIKEGTINSQKISELTFETVFELPLSKIKQIMTAYSFVGDANKIYFYTKDSNVHADIDDKTLQNIDNVSLVASNEFKGDPLTTPISVKLEVFKLLANSKSNIKVKINDRFKVFIFETKEDDSTQLKYIISALVK